MKRNTPEITVDPPRRLNYAGVVTGRWPSGTTIREVTWAVRAPDPRDDPNYIPPVLRGARA